MLFPGQGSQSGGMGLDVAANSPQSRALFERASAILDFDLLALQQHGPEEKLRETRFSQPAIFTTNVALYAALGAGLSPVVSAGHSFGELCSLVVADALKFDDAVRIVAQRGIAMQTAASHTPGSMSAVLGLDIHAVQRVVESTREATGLRLQLANFNSPAQIVISGDSAAVAAATEPMLGAGAKRVVALNVSGAWHSALMDSAVEPFAQAVESVAIAMPHFDVISNVDAKPYRDVAQIRRNLVLSINHEVLWHETAEKLLEYDLDMIVEFGASAVLGPLMKRLPGAPPVFVVSDWNGVTELRSRLESAVSA